jgi:hypothetical protein
MIGKVALWADIFYKYVRPIDINVGIIAWYNDFVRKIGQFFLSNKEVNRPTNQPSNQKLTKQQIKLFPNNQSFN